MEMKQISETTLKIMITMEDLEEHGMELKDFLIPQEKIEEFFYTVMDELDLPDKFKNSGMLSFRVTPRKDRVDVFVTKSDLKEDLISMICQIWKTIQDFLQKNSSKLLKITLWIREILKPTISSKSMIRP